MKILLGADQYPEYINAAATFTALLAAGLAAAGHTVDLLWPSAGREHHTYLDGGVRVHRLGSVRLPGRPRMRVCSPWTAGRQIDQILQIVRPDVVHVQSHLGLGRALTRARDRRPGAGGGHQPLHVHAGEPSCTTYPSSAASLNLPRERLGGISSGYSPMPTC